VKWIALAAILAAVLPLAGWLRSNPRVAPKVWIFVGLAPFVTGDFHLDVSVIDWAGWPGFVKGLQVSLLDVVALAILISQPRAHRSLPFRFVMALYFLAVVLSIFAAQVPMAAVFYAWQLARMFLVYVVVARACADEGVPRAILTGLAIGLTYQAVLTIWQRFGLGMLQTGGSFGHQNSLGLVSHFAVFPLFALLLAGERGWQTIMAPLAGLVIAVLTTSRATLGLAAIGLVLVFVISSIRGWTSTKAVVLVAGILVAALLSPIALSSFEQRFSAAPISTDYDERAAFENAASMMLSDHPLGVGANNYVVVANGGGYLDRANVSWAGGSRGTLVHNAYWLAAAETGYLGVAALILLMFYVTVSALRCGWRNRNDPRGDLLLGLGVSLVIVSIHNRYEWIFFFPFAQYLFAITTGLIAGLTVQLGYWQRAGTAISPPKVPQPTAKATRRMAFREERRHPNGRTGLKG
jgi:O-antigen ligase